MSGFGVFAKMNKKLEEGWKLTDADCPICKTTIVGNPTTKEMYCVSCEMPVKITKEEEEEDTEVEVVGNHDKPDNEYEDFDNMVIQRQNDPERKKANDLSKKTGELLLQGWTMLGDTCFDCLFPLMRSRQGQTICVGCGPVDQKKEKIAEEPIKEDKSHSSTEIISKPPQKEKAPLKPVNEYIPATKVPEQTYKQQVSQPEPVRAPVRDIEHATEVNRSGVDVFNAAQFGESISFYSRITELLTSDVERLAQNGGLLSNLDKVKKAMELQALVDEAKGKIFANMH